MTTNWQRVLTWDRHKHMWQGQNSFGIIQTLAILSHWRRKTEKNCKIFKEKQLTLTVKAVLEMQLHKQKTRLKVQFYECTVTESYLKFV